MPQSDSSPSSPGSPTRSLAGEIIRESGLAIGVIMGVSAVRDLAIAGRIDGNHALIGICVMVVPGLAAFGVQAIAARAAQRR